MYYNIPKARQDRCPLPTPSMSPLPTERQDARPEPPPSTITFQEYIATAKELQVHQRILLRLADRRLRSYLRAAPTPPPSPDRSAPASTLQSAAQPADTSGPPLPVWRLIRLDTPPPPQKPRLDPRLLPTDPRRYRAPLNGAQTPPLPEEIEREQRRKATHHQLALFLAKHPQPVRSARKKPTPTKLSLLRKRRVLDVCENKLTRKWQNSRLWSSRRLSLRFCREFCHIGV
ncbi:unnamed protein product [Trichogramma brassicae]|uniref:Uncharacterized protein n=1 Tax=Trichogramma brassicae TaxID=86971 RepID=A0A6H5I0Y8_9HYME|nr:unnamed protein product [Trichogramma brassicae]